VSTVFPSQTKVKYKLLAMSPKRVLTVTSGRSWERERESEIGFVQPKRTYKFLLDIKEASGRQIPAANLCVEDPPTDFEEEREDGDDSEEVVLADLAKKKKRKS
jgi:hypothetical protein